jgi:hypothetical protein
MQDWQQELWEIVESTADMADELCQDISHAIADITKQVKNEIAVNIEQFFQQLDEVWENAIAIDFDEEPFFPEIDDAIAFFDEDELTVRSRLEATENLYLAIAPKIEPSLETYPACIGCLHYHGRVYTGHLLICAMHPYGWDDTNCPDWEKIP